ncbi:MAG TPA: hypothetical protein VKB51_12110 [bacterium]|nr:hypothetical protein [bacterium]
MALGVSSYSDGRRRRAEPGPYGPRHPLLNALGRLEATLAHAWPLLRLPLTVLAVVHLVLVALFPGGQNALFGLTTQDTPTYASLFQVPDTLGFYTADGTDGFLVYKIYTQDGGMVNGVFPDTRVAPRLRYDRWATAGNAASGPYPELQDYVVNYVLKQLPSPPLRMELFAGHWTWDRNSLTFPWPGQGPDTTLELHRLGNYNGLTRTWEPSGKEDKRK